ncbi:MAG: SRPBCC domain-containing protein [Gelidibacter sp.]
MKTLKFTTKINAPKEKVWGVLWGKESYKAWTKAFAEGSDVKTDWKEGSSVWFTDGKDSGMYSIINKKVPNEQMTFKHLGMLKDGKELPNDETTESWSGAIEDYQLKEQNGITNVEVSVDITEEHKDYFDKTFPKALNIVKELSEQS